MSATQLPTLGVLALQGAFREHRRALEALGAVVREVRLPRDLTGLSGLIIPGGESTTIGKLMEDYALREPIHEFYRQGGAVWGTCAGAILLAKDIEDSQQPRLGLMNIRVRRNAFGRQVDSFATPLEVQGLDAPFEAVFIRAPVILSAAPGTEVLARHGEQIVLVRQGRLLASSFHPELTPDTRLHRLFLELARLDPRATV
ncbi:5'-phosphate synthase pdxT subunit [Deinobacterium chartae]|uniref:Pyridoxal 5'-phosphate synthase subunit PdxT n=1 Tax=Deinobacterium chartae TaxID=521158 RepID=A0A841HVK3_9DEIO|nr:pyridoxal 5'-phosphate synthase glutaminase subunit PdxT [Deinobacterium chartae]MBB6096694.1 5'-phosphate synthase pdxT subunit [Deinobacterium chartae]